MGCNYFDEVQERSSMTTRDKGSGVFVFGGGDHHVYSCLPQTDAGRPSV